MSQLNKFTTALYYALFPKRTLFNRRLDWNCKVWIFRFCEGSRFSGKRISGKCADTLYLRIQSAQCRKRSFRFCKNVSNIEPRPNITLKLLGSQKVFTKPIIWLHSCQFKCLRKIIHCIYILSKYPDEKRPFNT